MERGPEVDALVTQKRKARACNRGQEQLEFHVGMQQGVAYKCAAVRKGQMQTTALWLVLLPVAAAYYMAVRPDSHGPVLQFAESGAPVHWSSGSAAALLDTSVGVRINARGMHFFESSMALSAGVACVRSAVGLCALADGSVVLPSLAPPQVAHEGACATSSGRVFVDDSARYDVSACDIKNGLDIVFWNETVFFERELALSTYVYAFVALVVLCLVISLGQNLTHMLGDSHTPTYPVLSEFGCIVLVCVVIGSEHPWRVWVLRRDQELLVASIVYVMMYVLRHVIFHTHKFVYTFNVIVVALILATARLYGTFETPYATIFLALLLSRVFHKRYKRELVLLLGCDVVYIAYYYAYCFKPTFFDEREAPVYLVGIMYVTRLVGEYTSEQEDANVAEESELVQRVVSEHRYAVTRRAHGCHARYDSKLLEFFDLRNK